MFIQITHNAMKLILDNETLRAYMIPFAGTNVMLIKHKDTGKVFLEFDASRDNEKAVTEFLHSPEYDMLNLTLGYTL